MYFNYTFYFRVLFFGLLILSLAGCYRSVTVTTSTYQNYKILPSGFASGSSFCLACCKDDNMLTQEIAMKLESVLKDAGYMIKNRLEADYYLVFDYDIEEQQGAKLMPFFLPGTNQSTSGNIYGSGITSYSQTTNTSGQTMVLEQSYTYFIRKLILYAYPAYLYREQKQEQVVWSGSAVSVGSLSDLRVVIDYLITAVFSHFGKNTHKAIEHHFDEWFDIEHSAVSKVKKTYISKME